MKVLPSITFAQFQREVRQDRLHKRDLRLNDRHRLWGVECGLADLDFLAVEYNHCTPVALVEYKRAGYDYSDDTCSMKSVRWLGDHAHLPVFFVIYKEDFSEWNVIPDNPIAIQELGSATCMSEFEYVRFLYRLRGWELPARVFKKAMKEVGI